MWYYILCRPCDISAWVGGFCTSSINLSWFLCVFFLHTWKITVTGQEWNTNINSGQVFWASCQEQATLWPLFSGQDPDHTAPFAFITTGQRSIQSSQTKKCTSSRVINFPPIMYSIAWHFELEMQLKSKVCRHQLVIPLIPFPARPADRRDPHGRPGAMHLRRGIDCSGNTERKW